MQGIGVYFVIKKNLFADFFSSKSLISFRTIFGKTRMMDSSDRAVKKENNSTV